MIGVDELVYPVVSKKSSQCYMIFFFFFKQKTAYEISACLVGSEMCIRDRTTRVSNPVRYPRSRASASVSAW